jgi:hypothetical protein
MGVFFNTNSLSPDISISSCVMLNDSNGDSYKFKHSPNLDFRIDVPVWGNPVISIFFLFKIIF